MVKFYSKRTITIPEGVVVPQDIINGSNDIVLSNIIVNYNGNTKELTEVYEYNIIDYVLNKLKEKYPKSNFVINGTIGEPYYPNKNFLNKIKSSISRINFKNKLIITSSIVTKIKSEEFEYTPSIFWIGKSKIQTNLDLDKARYFEKKFLFQNRNDKPHRKKLMNLVSNFPSFDNEFIWSYNAVDVNKEFKSIEGYPISGKKETEQMKVKDYHLITFCNLITESIINNVFITEKIDKSFLAKQPFIILGAPFYLKTLREMGFKTFSEFWDESYDNEIDSDKRIKKISDLVKDILSWDNNKCTDIYNKMSDILKHNSNLRSVIENNQQHFGIYSDLDYIKKLNEKISS